MKRFFFRFLKSGSIDGRRIGFRSLSPYRRSSQTRCSSKNIFVYFPGKPGACYVCFSFLFFSLGQSFHPTKPQKDVYKMASNGPMAIAVNTRLAPSADADLRRMLRGVGGDSCEAWPYPILSQNSRVYKAD